jgi:hypothetical protein
MQITRLVTLTNSEPKKSYDEIKTHFPTRTRVAIANKVKALRAAKNRKSPGSSHSSQQSVLHSKWTAEEVRYLFGFIPRKAGSKTTHSCFTVSGTIAQ